MWCSAEGGLHVPKYVLGLMVQLDKASGFQLNIGAEDVLDGEVGTMSLLYCKGGLLPVMTRLVGMSVALTDIPISAQDGG